MVYKTLMTRLDLLKVMCDNNKSGKEIKEYFTTFEKCLTNQLLYAKIKKLEQERNAKFLTGKGNIDADVMFVFSKPSQLWYDTGVDADVKTNITNMCKNAAAKINPIFDLSNIYSTFYQKALNIDDDPLFFYLVDEEIKMVQPKILIVMGQVACDRLIKLNYDMSDQTIYGEEVKKIGMPNIHELVPQTLTESKKLIWNKLLLFSEKED